MAFSMPTCAAARPDQNRQDLLEWLYQLDGREDPAHPQHARYTGLYQAMAERLGRAQLAGLAQAWHELEVPPLGQPLLLRSEVAVQFTPEPA